MSVFDKELIINGKAIRSPEQQVWKNMKDIEKLKSLIKEAYRTGDNVELNTASISVAKSLTNAGADVKDGWLLDSIGSLFKITGGDEDSLLLDFYSSLRGPQGESGAELEIDDNETSATKVWSSEKVAQELTNAGKQMYQHNLYAYNIDAKVYFTIISDKSTEYNETDLKNYLSNKDLTSTSKCLQSCGFGKWGAPQEDYDIYGIFISNSTIKCRTYLREGNSWGSQNFQDITIEPYTPNPL